MNPELAIGDVGLSGLLAQAFVSRLIKLGAAVGQYQTPDKEWHRYPEQARDLSHSFLVVSEQGKIAEAVERGVRYAHISKYKPDDYLLLRMGVDKYDQRQVVEFAENVVNANYEYGRAAFAACGINCLLAHFKHRLVYFGVGHTKICSSFVADALRTAGVTWWKPEPVTMPADIYVQFGHLAA